MIIRSISKKGWSGVFEKLLEQNPDDESISTGGILAKYSANGFRTVLAYGTAGEAGDILNPDFVTPKPGLNIKEIRAIELAAAVKSIPS